MNPFRSSNPNLSSSDRTRDKKSTYIYAAAKKKFQSGKRCGTKNIKYYKKGTVRSIANYKLQQDLARGNVLCEDCNNRGNLCGSINPSALTRVHMHNSSYSEYWGGSSFANFGQTPGFPVIQSDVSGIWGPASPPEISKSDLSNAVIPNSDPSLNMPFGYINNLIDIPRNLDGSGIVIDPSNILFQDSNCRPFKYMKYVKLKTYVVIRGSISVKLGPKQFPDDNGYLMGSSCTDPSYNDLLNKSVIIQIDPTTSGTIVNGVLEYLCCVRTQEFIHSPVVNTPQTFGIFDAYINVSYISDWSLLNKWIKFTPPFHTSMVIPFSPLNPVDGWDWRKISNLVYPRWTIQELDDYGHFSDNQSFQIESIKVMQGSIPRSANQFIKNQTTQSYMSCLEDGTKKIKFT